jgi:hypothetical protein
VNEQSLGELVATMTRDMSVLVHKEVELAKAELVQEVKRAGLGIGLLGGSGFFGYFGLLFLSIAAAFGISALGVSLGIGFVCVAAGYLGLAGMAGLLGLRKMVKVSPPERTIRTVRDDLAWMRHPTVAPDPELEELRATHTG